MSHATFMNHCGARVVHSVLDHHLETVHEGQGVEAHLGLQAQQSSGRRTTRRAF